MVANSIRGFLPSNAKGPPLSETAPTESGEPLTISRGNVRDQNSDHEQGERRIPEVEENVDVTRPIEIDRRYNFWREEMDATHVGLSRKL